MQHVPRIFITGGTGFLGSAVVRALGDRPLRLLVRNIAEYRDRESRTIELVEGDVTDSGSLRDAMHGCDTVIHLVGIIEESRNRSFDLVIREGTEKVIAEARAAHVHRFVQISAIGARDDPTLPYQQAKWRAETAVRRSGLEWTILRPSIIFGPGDGFVSLLANLVRRFPVTPIPGDGSARFQPIAVGDVADAIAATLDHPTTIGQTLEIAGPDVVSYEQLLGIISQQLGLSRRTVHIPMPLMRFVVAASRPLPRRLRPPVTADQLKMLRIDNVSSNSATERLIERPPRSLAGNLGYIQRR
jgi:NADH dehydrogenase